MSGLAKMAINMGCRVSGSDINFCHEIDLLKGMGVDITIPHNASCINKDIDLVVYSVALPPNNIELVHARNLGIKVMERAEFLGQIAQGYKSVIAVAGTHGKTTTTSMIAEILMLAGVNPTVHIGGESVALGGNTHIGDKDYLILEACEYKESFRHIDATIGVITNIELDHVDYYRDYDDIKSAFERFACNCSTVITRKQDCVTHNNNHIIGKDWSVKNVEFKYNGYNFDIYYQRRLLGNFRLNMIGEHNVCNAVSAIICTYIMGVDLNIITQAISMLEGVERRYECVHSFDNGCKVIIDYAHHPTEIKCSTEGVQHIYNNILYVFQPHTYSRTKALMNDFVEVLDNLNNVIIYPTYPAREKEIAGGRAEDLHDRLKKSVFVDNIDTLLKLFGQQYRQFDCILIVGAGDLAEKIKRTYL